MDFISRFFFKNVIIYLFLICFSWTQSQDRPNILWINCDDLGREIGCYGNNDVKTPNIDKFASQGVTYLNAYANTPVCSASRSSIITGVYPNAINALNHRTIEMQNLPEGVHTIMELFKDADYFCSNGWAHDMSKPGKEDYNFLGNNFFDGTEWKLRENGQPFFAQVQIHEPHRVFVRDKANPIHPDSVTLPACYPDYPLLRADWALYLESIQKADKSVGKILKRLDEDGLSDNTIVILFGDHGRPHLRDKQWLYEGGLAIPLIVRYPKKYNKVGERKELISLVDVAASSLKLSGIKIPKYIDGKTVLNGEKRKYVYGFRQRCGDAVDDIRSISDGRYKLIWNRRPELPYMQVSSYKKLQYPAFTLYNVLHKNGELQAPYNALMVDKRPEFELYDLQNDPSEFSNLALDVEFQKTKKKLFSKLNALLNRTEKNMIAESLGSIQKAKESSEAYFINGMLKKGLPPDATDETILKAWEQELLK